MPLAGGKVEVDIDNLQRIYPSLPYGFVSLSIDADNLEKTDDDLFKINAKAVVEGQTYRLIISRKKGRKGWTTHVETNIGPSVTLKSDRQTFLDFELTDELLGNFKFNGKIVSPDEANGDLVINGRLYKLTALLNQDGNLLNAAIKTLRGKNLLKVLASKTETGYDVDITIDILPLGRRGSSKNGAIKISLNREEDGKNILSIKAIFNDLKIFDYEMRTLLAPSGKLVIDGKLSEDWRSRSMRLRILADPEKQIHILFLKNLAKWELNTDWSHGANEGYSLTSELIRGEDYSVFGWHKKRLSINFKDSQTKVTITEDKETNFDLSAEITDYRSGSYNIEITSKIRYFQVALLVPFNGWNLEEFAFSMTGKGMEFQATGSLTQDGKVVYDLNVDTKNAPYSAALKAPDLLPSLLPSGKPSIVVNIDMVYSDAEGMVTKLVLQSEEFPTVVIEQNSDGSIDLTVADQLVAKLTLLGKETHLHTSLVLPMWGQNASLVYSASDVDFSYYRGPSHNVKLNAVWESYDSYEWTANGVWADWGLRKFSAKEKQKLRDANNIVWTYNEAAELSNGMSYGYEMELDVNMKYWVFNRGKFGVTINEIGFVYSTTDGIRFVPNISEFLDSSLVYLGV